MAADINTPFTPEAEDLTARRPASRSRKAVAGKSLSPFKLNLKVGIAIDLRRIREDELGMSLTPPTNFLGWASRMELNRFEHAKDKGHHISVQQYIDLMGFYFSHLPATAKDRHPAGALLDDEAIKCTLQALRKPPPRLYEYLAWMHGLVQTGDLPRDHPAERLWAYLDRLGG